MTDQATSHSLAVPGGKVYYEVRGSGPLLLVVGQPMTTLHPVRAEGGSAALRRSAGDHRVGETSREELASRSAIALAERLGQAPVIFPGDHGGFVADPAGFAAKIREVLAESG